MEHSDNTSNEAPDPAREAMKLAASIRPMLAGRPPEAQGAALADLLAIWLAGHVASGLSVKTVTEELLRNHVELVLKLLPINVADILARKGQH
jgi:hypothetical protein